LVAGGGAAFNLNSERTELLDEAPHFRAAGVEFAGDFGATDDDSGVVHQETNDAAETGVGELHGRGSLARTSWSLRNDAGIMREAEG
jgi:hypothetical protein